MVFSGLLCNCKEEVEPTPYTYSQLVSGTSFKIWKATHWQLKEEGKADLNSGFPDCVEDDLYHFYADENRTFEVYDEREKCDPEDPDKLVTSTWVVINARATMEFIIPFFSSSPLPWTIENLEDDEFEVSFHFNNQKSINIFFELEEEGD
jgi:hypothetical protein